VETRGIEPLTPALQRSSGWSGTVVCIPGSVSLCLVTLVRSRSVGTLGNIVGNTVRHSAGPERARGTLEREWRHHLQWA